MSTGPDTIAFLCPNGHRLTGPKKLQGRPGQCPHCGVKFMVPSEEDYESPDDEPDEFESESPEPDEAPMGRLPSEPEEFEQIDELSELDVLEDIEAVPEAPVQATVPIGDAHPLFLVFRHLWLHRPQGASIELYLAQGEFLEADGFYEALSHGDYCLFAMKTDEGHTLTSIPWSAVSRIAVRAVPELPEGWQE